MRAAFEQLVGRYGQSVICKDKNGGITGAGKAFFQPVTDRERQRAAGALGQFYTDRFLCLAPAALELGEAGDGGWLEHDGEKYRLMVAHPVRLGEEITHQWAVLERKDVSL